MNGTSTMVNRSSNCSMLSRHSASASEYSSERVSRSESVVDSDGREATSSSDSTPLGCVEGTMYADMEKEGLLGAADMVDCRWWTK